MKKKLTPLVVGNWKMNPGTVGEAKELFIDIRKGIKTAKDNVDIVIAPPYPYMSELQKLAPSKRILLAAQDIFYERKGAYTGEISISMLKSVGVTHAIIGHSERRALGETDEVVNKDLIAGVTNGLTSVLCIGESKRDSSGHYFTVVEKQLRACLKDFPKSKLKFLSVMYEPVWAISSGDGKGKTATPEDIEEMRLFMQKVLADLFGRNAVGKIRILYGGSVNNKNALEILEGGGVDGFVIGGASLRAGEFTEIVKITEAHVKK